MPGLEKGPQEAFDWTKYDFAEDRENGPRDAITNAALEAMKKKSELDRRTFETSDMINGGNVNKIILPEDKPEPDDTRDS